MQVTKLNAAGATLWQRSVGPVGSLGRSTGIGTDASGNVLVTGYLVNTNGQSQGAVVAKLDAAGNVLWLDADPGHLWLGAARRWPMRPAMSTCWGSDPRPMPPARWCRK
jgi:hypothetical protein